MLPDLSSASHIVKLESRLTTLGCFRRNLAHREWNVPICKAVVLVLPMSLLSRSRISFAALLVKVTAHIDPGLKLCVRISLAILDVKTCDIISCHSLECSFEVKKNTFVFPLPGPAKICSGMPGSCLTAVLPDVSAHVERFARCLPFSWAGFNPAMWLADTDSDSIRLGSRPVISCCSPSGDFDSGDIVNSVNPILLQVASMISGLEELYAVRYPLNLCCCIRIERI